VCTLFRVKSILGVDPKVKDSIEDPFKKETWLGSVHDGLHVRVKGMTTASEIQRYVSTSVL
jgi:predicted transcriptional regulator